MTTAIFAGLKMRLSGIVGRGFFRSSPEKSATTCAHAKSAFPTQKSGGKAQRPVNLKARALRLYNRNDKAALRYEQLHIALGVRNVSD